MGCGGFFTAIWASAHLIWAVPARHFSRIFLLVGIAFLSGLLLIPVALFGLIGFLLIAFAVVLRILLCYHTYLGLMALFLALIPCFVVMLIVGILLFVSAILLPILHLPVMTVAFLMAVLGILFVLCDFGRELLKTADNIKLLPLTNLCVEDHPVFLLWSHGKSLIKSVSKLISHLANFAFRHFGMILPALDKDEEWDCEQALFGNLLRPLVYLSKLCFETLCPKIVKLISSMFDWFFKKYVPMTDTMVENAQEDTYARLEEAGYPEMVFEGRGGIVAKDSPVASFRLKHNVTARATGYTIAIFLVLILDFEYANAAGVAAGSAKFLQRIFCSIANTLLLSLCMIIFLPCCLLGILGEVFRVMITLFWLIGTIVFVVFMSLFMVALALGIPLVVFLAVVWSIAFLPSPFLLALIGIIVQTPVIGTFIKVFCCGLCFDSNVSIYGFKAMWKGMKEGFEAGVELIKLGKEVAVPLVRIMWKMACGMPSQIWDQITDLPDDLEKIWQSLVFVRSLWSVPGRLWRFMKGCGRRICDPAMPPEEGGILAVILVNTAFTTVLSHDRKYIVREKVGGKLMASPLLLIKGPDGVVNLGTAVEPNATAIGPDGPQPPRPAWRPGNGEMEVKVESPSEEGSPTATGRQQHSAAAPSSSYTPDPDPDPDPPPIGYSLSLQAAARVGLAENRGGGADREEMMVSSFSD